ncbi:alpha/beta-hydrolase [Byssothecium circinans]|uniref:Alpha/beta-hydrolase n=1 Tax=Byssothecium circinans TaxID=147558 RepID=A0A6A5UHD4_9PLEO|nr:alpha/beta-hydrolase [Byssothecium circinans]
MATTSAINIQDTKLKSLGLSKTVVNKEQVNTYTRNLASASAKNPVLALLHGYPQSAYMWRHLIPLLPRTAPLFVPDLPGYGASAPMEKNDKLSVGNAVIAALKAEVKRTSSRGTDEPIPVVLIGHDRGARVAQRLAVSGAEGVEILGVVLVDIVPVLVQWQASSSAAEVVSYFHWPFLANVDLANRMITAFGGANWCHEMMHRWSGTSPASLSSLESDDSFSVYAQFMTNPATIDASNKDYEAGATVDIEAQREDQEKGRKIEVPLLLIYSEGYIGKRFDFEKVWREWVGEGVGIEKVALGGGVGHFGVEEAPGECAEAINGWLGRVVG